MQGAPFFYLKSPSIFIIHLNIKFYFDLNKFTIDKTIFCGAILRFIKFLLVFSFANPLYCFEFSIIHTNDLHSYVEGVGPGKLDERIGGYSRIVTKINQLKSDLRRAKEPYLLLDAGDFYSGTLFHALGPLKNSIYFPEYEFFEYLKFDAITLGNHEFDAKDNGLEVMLGKISKRSNAIPLVSTNIYLKDNKSNLSKYFGPDKLIKPYVIKKLENKGRKLKIGIIGLLGPDGCLVSRATRKEGNIRFLGYSDSEAEINWKPLITRLQNTVDILRNKEKVDLVVALMHGGTSQKSLKGEDDQVAEKVKGIDVIIAGHTHRKYTKRTKNTLISQAGSFGRFLGVLKLKKEAGQLKLRNKNKTFIKITSSIKQDTNYLGKILNYKEAIRKTHLRPMGQNFKRKIVTPSKDYIRKKEEMNAMGRVVTTAIATELSYYSKEPIDLYFTSLALIRNDFKKGLNYQFSDIFELLPIGFGKEFSLGSPIVSFYLTKSEVRKLILFMEYYAKKTPTFTPAFSENISYKNRSWGIPFIFQIKDLKFKGKDYSSWPELIHVGTTEFVASYIDMVEKVTFGLVKFRPKNGKGVEINKYFEYKQKEYQLLADYLVKNKI